jgi:hypothetical protein
MMMQTVGRKKGTSKKIALAYQLGNIYVIVFRNAYKLSQSRGP